MLRECSACAVGNSGPLVSARKRLYEFCVFVCVVFFQIALEVIEELCYEMGLHRLEAMEEYAIFLVTNRGVLTNICFSISHTLTNIKGCIRAQKSILLLLSVRQIHSQITYQTVLWFLDVGESPS